MGAITDRDEINLLALKACAMGARTYAVHGVKLARNLPTVAELRRRYGITARTYADAADQLDGLYVQLREAWQGKQEARAMVAHLEVAAHQAQTS